MKAEAQQSLAPASTPKGAKSPVELRTISAQEAGQRIDNFLMRHFSRVPRSRVYRLLRKGEVRVNRKRVDAEYRIAAGDEVRLPPAASGSTPWRLPSAAKSRGAARRIPRMPLRDWALRG